MKKRFFIFDGDFTVIDSESLGINAINQVRRENGDNEIPYDELQQFIRDDTNTKTWTIFYTKLVEKYHSNLDSDAKTAKVKDYINRVKAIASKGAPLYDGMPELLKQLHANGNMSFIASKSPKELAEKSLANSETSDYVELVTGNERHSELMKPEKQLFHEVILPCILNHLQALGEPIDVDTIISLTVVIGDQEDDIRFGKNIGCDTIYLSSGIGDDEACSKLQPTITTANHAKLITIIDTMMINNDRAEEKLADSSSRTNVKNFVSNPVLHSHKVNEKAEDTASDNAKMATSQRLKI